MRTHLLFAVCGVVVMAGLPPAVAAASPPALAPMPWTFIENRGQWDRATKFAAHRGDVGARIERDALALDLPRGPDASAGRVGLRFVFEGALAGTAVEGEDPSRAVTSFLLGNDPARWRRGVPSYHQVVYRDLYAGVDVRVREEAGRLEYDVLVEPGADLAPVVIRCEGASALGLAADGSLEMETGAGTMRQAVPVTWQELLSGGRITVECHYRLLGGGRYGFAVPGRDPALPLVIDPDLEWVGLEWSTFFGTSALEAATGIAVERDGDVIVAGLTQGLDFPTTPGAYDTTYSGGVRDGWIACFDPWESGVEQLVWCTYLGGQLEDRIADLELDRGNGTVLVIGRTNSTDFPTTPNAYDPSHNGDFDAFVSRLSADGSTLSYSTFLGGAAADYAVNVDPSAASGITVSGYTASSGFPTTPGAYDRTWNGGYDAFIARLDPSLTSLGFSTFLGGSSDEVSFELWLKNGLTVSASGAVTVGGTTASPDFPVLNAYQAQRRGAQDAFLARLSPGGDALEFSTYFGSTAVDAGSDVAIGRAGDIVLVGCTFGGDLQTTPGAFDTSFNNAAGIDDGFVACFDFNPGNPLLLRYSTFLGGSDYDSPVAAVVDAVGDVLVVGLTTSSDFPTTPDAYDLTYGGVQDAILVRLRPLGDGSNDLVYGTFLGGRDVDIAQAVAVPPGGSIMDAAALAGGTYSDDFPATPGAFDGQHNGPGSWDAFAACLASIGPLAVEEPPVVATTPASPRLGAPHPNPSQGPVAFAIDLPARARVRVNVYDVSGRLVAELLDREVASGRHELSWEPAVLRRQVSPGTYFIRLVASRREESQKVVIEP